MLQYLAPDTSNRRTAHAVAALQSSVAGKCSPTAPGAGRYGADLDARTPKGWTPLSYAVAKGKYGATEEKGIYPEVRPSPATAPRLAGLPWEALQACLSVHAPTRSLPLAWRRQHSQAGKRRRWQASCRTKLECDQRAQGRMSMFVASPGASLHHRVREAAPRLGAEHEALVGCLRVCALR